MRPIMNIIASNGLAIILTIICVLPITAIFAYSLSAPLDEVFSNLGLLLRETRGWSLAPIEAELRFAKISFAIRSVVIAVGISCLYFWITNWLNSGLARAQEKESIGRQSTIVEAIQPWIFVGPALVLLTLFLVVPAFMTLGISFQEANGTLTTNNYSFLWDPKALGYVQFRFAMRNSLMWLILVPTFCIIFGLAVAVLADSLRWGVVAKTFIFVPMAISFVGAAVIWRNIFAGGGIEAQQVINGFTPSYQTGLLKSMLGHSPSYNEPLYNLKFWGNFFLMWIMVWIKTGFAMVIFSAVEMLPGDFTEAVLGQRATVETVAAFRKELGLDQPAILRYLDWLGSVCTGDLGTSFSGRDASGIDRSRPVTELPREGLQML